MSAIIGIAALGSFTLHYVSINTEMFGNELSLAAVFTFHYVSINTFQKLVCVQVDTHFTFHYVSINTQFPILLSFWQHTLHSTMFLLILSPFGPCAPVSPFFTVHYVSINTFCGRFSVLPDFLYIPLCFY